MASEPPSDHATESTGLPDYAEHERPPEHRAGDQSHEVTVYSRAEVVTALTSFYTFLTRLHVPPFKVIYPPQGGWPHLNECFLAEAGKTDTVIDLLRHIPYIQRGEDEEYEPYMIYDCTSAIDYTNKFSMWDPHITTLPPHVVTIAGPDGRNGFWFFLDTQRGTITRCDFQTGWQLEDGRDGPEPLRFSQNPRDFDPAEDWRAFETYRIKDFYDFITDQFRNLQMCPVSLREVSGAAGEEVEALLRDHGWLSNNFRRDECFELLEAVSDGKMSWPPKQPDSAPPVEATEMNIPLR